MNSWLLIRRLRGPAFLILFGITALLNQWGVLSFSRSWPLYLILAGVFSVLERALVGVAPPVFPAGYPSARAQRDYLRVQRRRSLVGPVLLVAAGVIALLIETNQLNGIHLWDWYLRWWPLLLIVVGLLSLGEWWLGGRYQQFRRGSHGGLVALIVILALVGYLSGSTMHSLHGMHLFGHGDDEDDLFSHLLGEEHDADRSLNQHLPAGTAVDIQVPHGDVTVTASGDDQIHVQAHLVVFSSNDKEVRRRLDALEPKLTVNGQSAALRVEEVDDGHAELTIEIPVGSIPTITAKRGDVTVEGLSTPATVNADRGDVKIDHLTGSVHVRMGKGDFTAYSLSGDLALEGKLDDTSISDMQGRVALDGDFFGDTHIARVQSGVHFHSSRTDVEVIALPGDLSIDSGDLQVNDATGPTKISTSAKDVECTGVSGDMRVEDGDGDITVGAIKPIGELQIHNRNGAINLTMPVGAGFMLQATAKNGDIDSKLDLPVNSVGEGKTVSGKVGSGGPKVDLAADHGDIEISESDAPPEPHSVPPVPPVPPVPSVPPVPPVPGSKPSKSLRHLHATSDHPAETVTQ